MTPAGTSNELDVQNGWEENTHTHTRRKSARYAREFSFARCQDKAGAIILILLHWSPAGNTSRTGELTSPAAKRAELNDVVRFWRLESKEKTKDCCA